MKLSRTLRNGYNFAVVKTDFASSSVRALLVKKKLLFSLLQIFVKFFREKTSLSAFMVFEFCVAATNLKSSEIGSPISSSESAYYHLSDHRDAIFRKESILLLNVEIAGIAANALLCLCSSLAFPAYVLYSRRLCGYLFDVLQVLQ